MTEEMVMDLLLLIATMVGGLLALGALAATSGAESRDSIGDDWARSFWS